MSRTPSNHALGTTEGAALFVRKPRRDELLADYPDLLTVGHVCELTGLSAQTVRKEINAGRLPGCRIGRRLYVPKPGFTEYITEGGGVYVPHAATR